MASHIEDLSVTGFGTDNRRKSITTETPRLVPVMPEVVATRVIDGKNVTEIAFVDPRTDNGFLVTQDAGQMPPQVSRELREEDRFVIHPGGTKIATVTAGDIMTLKIEKRVDEVRVEGLIETLVVPGETRVTTPGNNVSPRTFIGDLFAGKGGRLNGMPLQQAWDSAPMPRSEASVPSKTATESLPPMTEQYRRLLAANGRRKGV